MAYRTYKVFHQAYTAGRVASCKASKDFLKNKTKQHNKHTLLTTEKAAVWLSMALCSVIHCWIANRRGKQ